MTTNRYCDLALKKYLANEPTFKWCSSLFCQSGQFHPCADIDPRMKCLDCGLEVCIAHGRPWHVDETCEEYQVRIEQMQREEEALFLARTKPCPNCQVRIDKMNGNDHMICSK